MKDSLRRSCLRVVGIAVYATLLNACSAEPSKQEIRDVARTCEGHFKNKRAEKGDIVKAVDYWMKNGKLVIEIGYSKNTDSYRSQVCVYDKEKETYTLPALFDQPNWRK